MISTRFAGPTIALMALALVPTTIHSYLAATETPPTGIRTLAISPDGQPGEPTGRPAEWAVKRFDSDDFLQQTYYGRAVMLTVVRSFDPKRLYHHPELATAYPDEYAPATIARVPEAPALPIHLLTGENASRDLRSMYVLVYDGRYVENPISFQLRTSLELLVSRRKPMTLVFVREAGLQPGVPLEGSRGLQVLLAAVRSLTRSQARE